MAKSNYSPMHIFAITKLFFLSVDCTHMFNISVNQLQQHSGPVSDTSYGVQPQKVHSGSFWGTFRAASSTKHQTRVALELIAVRGENNFNPRRHQNRILAPLGGSFQNFRQASPSFYTGVLPWELYTCHLITFASWFLRLFCRMRKRG